MSHQEKVEHEIKLVDGWIKELTDAGYTPFDMISIFREAKHKAIVFWFLSRTR